MDEIDEIKKRRLDELKRLRHASNQQQETQMQQQINQLEEFVRQYFTKEALSRYGNLKIAHPDKAIQLLVLLGQTIQSKQIGMIDDNNLKEILKKLTPVKRDIKIRKV